MSVVLGSSTETSLNSVELWVRLVGPKPKMILSIHAPQVWDSTDSISYKCDGGFVDYTKTIIKELLIFGNSGCRIPRVKDCENRLKQMVQQCKVLRVERLKPNDTREKMAKSTKEKVIWLHHHKGCLASSPCIIHNPKSRKIRNLETVLSLTNAMHHCLQFLSTIINKGHDNVSHAIGYEGKFTMVLEAMHMMYAHEQHEQHDNFQHFHNNIVNGTDLEVSKEDGDGEGFGERGVRPSGARRELCKMGMESLRHLKRMCEEVVDNTVMFILSGNSLNAPTASITIFPPSETSTVHRTPLRRQNTKQAGPRMEPGFPKTKVPLGELRIRSLLEEIFLSFFVA
ncbi:hypothetical protein Fmac_018038 [Flemingia macrophylla]|uniref:Uncharacterized protein n=1 Tax=Flemingia macrophylla TaxID=520843 RepID=A0ABD1M3T0_9FABA